MSDPIYLDHNATTPLLPEVLDAMLPYLRDHFGNPSSSHVYGQRTREAIERARVQVAALIACEPEEITFTSGGTEASNLAIRGAVEALPGRSHIITTNVEHPATAAVFRWLGARGKRVDIVAVDPDGTTSPARWEGAISNQTALISVMHANNETGVFQPVHAISALARPYRALVHVDAAQSLGKVDVTVDGLGADLLSIAGHKLYAPKGVGALYVRSGVVLRPFTLGAGHERGMRPGTENVASIVGLGAACAIAGKTLGESSQHARMLRDRLWDKLKQEIPGLKLNGHMIERLPNTLSVRFPGVSGNALLEATPGVAASTGSACHSKGETASQVILAMGVSHEDALGTVRLTTGRLNTIAQIDRAAVILAVSWRQLKRT
jgi:cysteine desulfurase